MRVLLISHTCQSRTEGQPRADHLGRIPGVDLRVLTPDRWKNYGKWRNAESAVSSTFGLQVGKVALPWTGPGQCYLHWYPELRDILEEFRPDVIDLWEEPWGLVSAHACWLRNRVLPEARVICETEQNVCKKLPSPFERFRRYVLRNADFAVARSGQALGVLRARGYVGPAEVVPNAVDTDLFRPMDANACRKGLGLDGFIVGYVGRIVEEKGVSDLLEALALCHQSVRLVLAGCGPAEETVRARAKKMGRADCIHFLGARRSGELPRLMNALDCLVLSSRTMWRWKEQFGRVLIEAGACGVAVIASDSGAIPEVVGDAGLIVPERNASALAAAIEELRSDTVLRQQLGAAGRRRAESLYSWQRVAQHMHGIYAQLLSANRCDEKSAGDMPTSLVGLEG